MVSKSEKFLQQRELPPVVSPSMYKGVSEYRKNTLAGEVRQNLFRDGSSMPTEENPPSVIGAYAPSQLAITKKANYGGGVAGGDGGSGGWRGASGDVTRQISGVYSPLWLNSNLNLPRDRATINSWCRSFFALHPWVQNAISLHSTYPISKLTIKCKNKKVEKFFNTMIEEIDLLNVCTQVAQEYWLLGEAFVYAELDESKAMWSRLVIQNPDYVVVKKSVMSAEPLIMLRPDENLRRIVMSNRPADIEQKKHLNETIISHIKRGENIPLDSFFVSHLARKIAPYEVRGTGLPVCCFRQFMIFDMMRESKFVQAHSMINPLTLISVGQGAEHRTNLGELEAYREIFAQAESDPNYKIITHDAVKVERVGYNQGIYDISGDITQLMKEIYVGLMAPQAVIEGTGDITYASSGVALDVLKQRYLQFRNMLSSWLTNKIFAPISKMNDFYDHEDGQRVLVVPEIEWNHMSLFETSDYVNTLVQLTNTDQKKVSNHTLYRSLGLDYDDERLKMRKEDIMEAVRVKELASLARIPLNELRTLTEDEDAEIPEITEDANAVNSPYSDASQAAPGAEGGMGGMPGGGGAPPMLPALPGLGSAPPSAIGAPTPEMGAPPPGGAGLGGPPPSAPLK